MSIGRTDHAKLERIGSVFARHLHTVQQGVSDKGRFGRAASELTEPGREVDPQGQNEGAECVPLAIPIGEFWIRGDLERGPAS